MSKAIDIGTRVAFSRAFCRNTGQITGWTPFARGIVIALDNPPRGCPAVATVAWDNHDSESMRILVTNLVRADRMHLELV